jgi:Phage integrase family
MRQFLCKGGGVVQVSDEDHWLVPYIAFHRECKMNIDFTQVQDEVRPWWRSLLEGACKTIPPNYVIVLWNTVRWFTRFLEECGLLTTKLDDLSGADWRSYAEWLKKQRSRRGLPLSSSTRRNQFAHLCMAARQAIILDLPGVLSISVERLLAVTRSAFKDKSVDTQRYIERRALNSEQYTELYAMMAEEWQLYLESEGKTRTAISLPALVACWLAFNEGVRPVELNCLTVDDLQVDDLYGKHSLLLCAPNKQPDMIPIEKDTLLLLQTLIDESAETRAALETNLLFVSRHRGPHLLSTAHLNLALRSMIQRHQCQSLPVDLKLADGRTTLGTHLAYTLQNRERVRRIMRHAWASTTEMYYRARQKLVVAGNIAKALRAEAWRLTIACQRPVLDINERPDQADILRRNPSNAELEWGSCGLDVERQGGCRMARHCFECPLLVPWVSKRHNYVAERDEYLHKAEKAENSRDRENLLYHANLAEAYLALIDRRREENIQIVAAGAPTRQRRPRRSGRSA